MTRRRAAAELHVRRLINVAAMNTTIRLAETGDHNVVVALVLAFRDHSHQGKLSDAEVASSVERLLVDPQTDFLLALSERGDALGYIQLRYQYSLWVSSSLAQVEDLFVASYFADAASGYSCCMRPSLVRASDRHDSSG